MKLFVWGTMLRGECNHSRLVRLGAKFLEVKQIKGITGELYEIPIDGFIEMARFEGTANFIHVIVDEYIQRDGTKEAIYMFVESPANNGNSWYKGHKLLNQV